MNLPRWIRAGMMSGLVAVVAACGISGRGGQTGTPAAAPDINSLGNAGREGGNNASPMTKPTGKLGDLFSKSTDPNTAVRVNKYIWNAALDVLNFLPVESVDPFTGVIVTGYGTPPGGGRAYRATIYVQDPALDARSLNIAMESKGGGPVAVETVRAIEDAILTRARELRIQDGKL